MTDTKRATFAELLDFANKVRAAGGGNPLDALMPAIPTSESECLIARNLNFNCEVNCENDVWYMAVGNGEVADRIAAALDLPIEHWDSDPNIGACIQLPEDIGQVAEDFDQFNEFRSFDPHKGYFFEPEFLEEDQIALVREMAPYVEASEKEAYVNGTFDDDGNLIL